MGLPTAKEKEMADLDLLWLSLWNIRGEQVAWFLRGQPGPPTEEERIRVRQVTTRRMQLLEWAQCL